MIQLDDRILEFICEEGWSSPEIMAARPEFQASAAIINERCLWLASAGLIAPISGDLYELTTWGRVYLKGEIDAGHQPRPTQPV